MHCAGRATKNAQSCAVHSRVGCAAFVSFPVSIGVSACALGTKKRYLSPRPYCIRGSWTAVSCASERRGGARFGTNARQGRSCGVKISCQLLRFEVCHVGVRKLLLQKSDGVARVIDDQEVGAGRGLVSALSAKVLAVSAKITHTAGLAILPEFCGRFTRPPLESPAKGALFGKASQKGDFGNGTIGL